MIVSHIVAMDDKGGIGKNNRLPWHLPSDLKRFKQLTMGHHIIMGRKTYETIGRPLPGRKMIVLTRNEGYYPPCCVMAHTIEEAIKLAKQNEETEVFIIGGGDVFAETIGTVDRIYITRVCADTEADTYYPIVEDMLWKMVEHEGPYQGEKDEFSMCFELLIRRDESAKRD